MTNTAANALINDGKVKKKGDSINGAKIYINPSRRGSFEELITLVIEDKYISSIGASIISNVFLELIKWTWSRTFSIKYNPKEPHIRKLEDRIEPFIEEMEESLETPLQEAHRPIMENRDVVIVVKRLRNGPIVELNYDTLKSLDIHTEKNVVHNIEGNVTRYNILSGFGRFHDDELGHTVSFKMPFAAKMSEKKRITWSLHYAQEEGEGKILMDVRRVISAKKVIRRYLVEGVNKA